jgi:hypothetical protein
MPRPVKARLFELTLTTAGDAAAAAGATCVTGCVTGAGTVVVMVWTGVGVTAVTAGGVVLVVAGGAVVGVVFGTVVAVVAGVVGGGLPVLGAAPEKVIWAAARSWAASRKTIEHVTPAVC